MLSFLMFKIKTHILLCVTVNQTWPTIHIRLKEKEGQIFINEQIAK